MFMHTTDSQNTSLHKQPIKQAKQDLAEAQGSTVSFHAEMPAKCRGVPMNGLFGPSFICMDYHAHCLLGLSRMLLKLLCWLAAIPPLLSRYIRPAHASIPLAKGFTNRQKMWLDTTQLG